MAASRDEVSSPSSKDPPKSALPKGSDKLPFEGLVTDHYGFIWRVLRGLGLSRADAEDAAQQVFMIAARKFEHIAVGQARSFVYGIALRVASNARRGLRRRREALEPPSIQHEAASEASGPERSAEMLRARTLLLELLCHLPEKLRRVLVLAEIEQLEVPEIAALERVPVGTAASRLRRAREAFRVSLEAARDRNPFEGDS